MEKSTTIIEIAKALIEFHKEVRKVKKEATNPFFKSKYASLPNILDTIEQPLISSGLSFTQFPTGENQLTTLLMHTSGEWIQGSYKMTPTKNDPQALGSAITYQRRYALGAILGLNIDEDDDGNKASEPAREVKPKMDNDTFNKALPFIEKGTAGVYDKTISKYDLTAAQAATLKAAHNTALDKEFSHNN